MIYLNNAATSYPKPPCVLEAVQKCLREPPASQFRGGAQIGTKDAQDKCRESLGRLLGISQVSRIYFTSGATEALNTLLCGLAALEPFQKVGDILITQTEHNSVLRPLMNQRIFKQMDNFHLLVAPCLADGEITREALEKTVTKNTKAIVVNHCSNVTGKVQDMEMIGDFARNHHLLFFADVSQSAGSLPVRADDWGLDGLVFTGHKGLLGIQGTGGFFIREGLSLPPYKYGGTGRNSALLTYEEGDYEYEPGTRNLPGITALSAGADFILKEGLSKIMEKEAHLMELLYSGLASIPGIHLYGNAKSCKGPVMSFNFEGLSPGDAAYILQNVYDITVRTGLHCSPLIHKAMGTDKGGTLRVSVSCFTSEEDIRAFLEAAAEISSSVSGNS